MPSIKHSLCAAVLAVAAVVPAAYAQAPLEDTPIPMWVPDGHIGGNVSAAVKVGNTLVIGGQFDYVGPPTGPFAIVDGVDATNFNTSAGLIGRGSQVVSDGAGGWFANVTRADVGPSALVHIASDGRLDAGFSPPSNLAAVTRPAMDGGRLYVASSVGNAPATIFALDPATGADLSWVPAAPLPSPPSSITNLVVSQGVLYVAVRPSSFAFSTGLAFDAATGAVVPFPALATGEVVAAINDRVYVVTKTETSHTLQAYTRAGVLVPAFTAPPYYRVYRVVVSAGRVYAIVQDTGPSNTAPTRIAALDAATGAEIWSSPPPEPGGYFLDLSLDGTTLYVGGGFSKVGGASRTRLAAFDAGTGALLPWAPPVGSGVGSVAAANGRVALGGGFQSVGGITRRGLVALDLATGRPALVQPPESDAVGILALAVSGDLVVVATSLFYTFPSTYTAGEIFAYSAATGLRYPVALEVGSGDAYSLAISGSTLIIGGGFQTIAGQPRRHLAAYDLVAGQVLPWNPSPNDYVYKLKVAAPAVYAAGRFTAIAGTGRTGAAAFDVGSLQLTPWNPNIPNVNIYSLDVWQDRVFIGMHVRTDFTTFPATYYLRTLAVDRVVGTPSNIDLPIGPTMALVGGTLAVLTNLDQNARLPPATFDGATGQPLPWNPAVVSGGGLIGLDGYLLLLGTNSVGGRPIAGLAVFKPRIVLPGAPRQTQMTVTGSTVSLAWSPGASPAPLGYVIEAGSAPGVSDLGRFPVGLATQVAAVVAPGSYALRVRAIGASGEGPPSSEWLFTTPATSAPPSAPTALVGSVAGNVVTLGWNAAPGNTTTYVIEGGTGPGLSDLGVLATGSLDTAIAGAVPAGTYYFRVRAANAFGSSAPSNEIVLVVP